MKELFLAIFLLIPYLTFGQEKQLDEIISGLDLRQDTVEAVFRWVAENVSYDVRMKDKIIEMKRKRVSRKGDRSLREEEILKNVLDRRKGVCQDYSILFNALLHRLNFESVVVTGYTQDQKGSIDQAAGHAWNAVKVGNEWQLYDATWASGVVNSKDNFVQSYSEKWAKVAPSEMILTHMPFDPIWQFLEDPLTYDDFKVQNFEKVGERPSNHTKLVNDFLDKEDGDQALVSLERSRNMGKPNRLVIRWQSYRKLEIGAYGKMDKAKEFQEVARDLNVMTDQFNEYISAKNNQFRSADYNLEHASVTMSDLKVRCDNYRTFFETTPTKGADEKKFVASSLSQVKNFQKIINNEVAYLERRIQK